MKKDSGHLRDRPTGSGPGTDSGEIAQRLREAAVDGRVKCADAFAIAGELGVGVGRVGRVADEIKIKIASCQLGCF